MTAMTVRARIALGAMAVSVALLSWVIVTTSGGERIGAIGGLAGALFGVSVAMVAVRREHADDAGPLSPRTLLNETATGPGIVFVTMTVYFAFAFLAGGTALPILGGAALLASLAWGSRVVMRREGIEREQLLKGTSFAFFVTVLCSALYAMFESFADAPRLSMWAPWSVGMFTWAIAGAVLGKRSA